MTLFTAILPVFVVLLMLLTVWGIQRTIRNRFSRKTHFILMGAYMILLVAAFVAAEVIGHTKEMNHPPLSSAHQEKVDVEDAILAGKPVPEEELITERIHSVDGQLSLYHPGSDYDSIFYIERSKGNEKKVIERIYKPELTTGRDDFPSYDLSDYVKVNLPEWSESEMIFPDQPNQKLSFSSYYDSIVLNQFSRNEDSDTHVGSTIRYLIVHLIIPESIVLKNQMSPDYYIEVTRN
ncbi:hypothetical protein [Sporosarcina aquimarina]|uniref:Uncharacterized protein n=1 Tax=Sporosarcina aquimarina TaxID=114975 RepID=A0ABU4FUU7_9BACL|nr:hypothetical protein [Sporosarcina aquimarina]MDW0108496.1 hypothetical protein [Sporosarcina aquimarina]